LTTIKADGNIAAGQINWLEAGGYTPASTADVSTHITHKQSGGTANIDADNNRITAARTLINNHNDLMAAYVFGDL
jgi:hypothetical protein